LILNYYGAIAMLLRSLILNVVLVAICAAADLSIKNKGDLWSLLLTITA
jgi:hypothetical protein